MDEYIGYKTPMFGQKLMNGEDALVTVLTDEEIIRCSDCVMCDKEDGFICHRDPNHTGKGWPVNSDGFCAWAKRDE